MAEIELDQKALEAAGRAAAAEHYANRFRKPIDDPHVQMNVDAAWHIHAADSVVAIRAYLTALRPVSDEAVEAVTVKMVDAAIAALWHEITVHPGGSIENLDIGMRDALCAALAHTGKPTVKPLEWRGPLAGFYEADTIGGVIKIMDSLRNEPGRFILHPAEPCRVKFDTLAEAKAAAQADYEARILSALQTGSENG